MLVLECLRRGSSVGQSLLLFVPDVGAKAIRLVLMVLGLEALRTGYAAD